MKRVFVSVLSLALSAAGIQAQSTVHFLINFPGVASTNAPSGSASLSGSRLSFNINLGNPGPTYAWMEQMGQDGPLTPFRQFTNFSAINYPPGSSQIVLVDLENWFLTSSQIQDLLSGLWYAEIDYGAQTHLGHVSQVPEPEPIGLSCCGAFLYAAYRNRRFRRRLRFISDKSWKRP